MGKKIKQQQRKEISKVCKRKSRQNYKYTYVRFIFVERLSLKIRKLYQHENAEVNQTIMKTKSKGKALGIGVKEAHHYGYLRKSEAVLDTPSSQKKKNTQRTLLSKKRSVSKDSAAKSKKQYSAQAKTEKRVRSYTNLHQEPRQIPLMKSSIRKDQLYQRCQTILSEYQIKCEELVKENKRLTTLNDRLSSQKNFPQRKCS